MEEKISGLVLGGINLSENDKLLTLFTLEQGTISAKIKGVKKTSAKLKFAGEPFCFAEFIILKKGAYNTIINASLIDSFYPVREDIKKLYSASVVLEFIKKFAKENIVSHELFLSAISTLKDIAYGDNYLKSLVAFLLTGLSLSGYGLNLTGCNTCGKQIENAVYFDYKAGAFYCENCFSGSGKQIKIETFNALTCAFGNEKAENPNDGFIMALKLLDYYFIKKTEEKINSLGELLKIL